MTIGHTSIVAIVNGAVYKMVPSILARANHDGPDMSFQIKIIGI